MNEQKTNFEISIDTRALYDHLKKVQVGQTVTYGSMSAVLGRVVEGANSNLQSALTMLERDGLAFANVRGAGYQRMTDIEVVGTVEASRKAIRKKAERAIKRITCVQNFEALPNELKIKHNAAMSGFGAIASIMAPVRMRALEAAVASTGASLPLAKTLEAFKV